MDDSAQHSLAPALTATAASCPIGHAAWSRQKTAAISDACVDQDTSTKPAIERTADGVWHVYRFQEARAILRSDATKQAGFNDVQPAIKARKRQPQNDLISFMLSQNARNRDIQIECVTYAAAGMVTTREFITTAAWHMLGHPTLRARYLAAPEKECYLILEEILRIEPVVGHLYRRATENFQIESNGSPVAISKGDLIHLHTYLINQDPM